MTENLYTREEAVDGLFDALSGLVYSDFALRRAEHLYDEFLDENPEPTDPDVFDSAAAVIEMRERQSAWEARRVELDVCERIRSKAAEYADLIVEYAGIELTKSIRVNVPYSAGYDTGTFEVHVHNGAKGKSCSVKKVSEVME